MTTVSDDLIRAFLADEARRAVAAAPSLDEAVGRLAPRVEGRPSGASQRLIVLLAATLLLVAAIGAIAVGSGLLRLPLVVDIPTASPFEGTWVSSSDTDGGTQTMTVRVSADGAVEIVVHDNVATVCSGTPSTMTGAGRIVGGTQLVIPAPVYTCDDESEAQTLSGPPLEEQLRDWTLVLDPQTDTLTGSSGGLWAREGAELPSPDSTVTISDTMWPQSSLEEVQEAQRLADAGDPDYTWQVDSQLFTDDTWAEEPGQIAIVDRFLREVLGWEAYVLNGYEGMVRNGIYDVNYDQRYLRCAPVGTNPLYPPGPDPEWGELCAPTLDDLRYESVSLDLAQPVRRESDGIWVVNRWSLLAPFAQSDPAAVEAQVTERLEEFLDARIAGTGADGYVQFDSDLVDVPLLYATTSGAAYERYELELLDGPEWPYGNVTFSARLFADGDAIVVEQEVAWTGHDPTDVLWLNTNSTTENGQPVLLSYASRDDEVSASTPSTWVTYWPGKDSDGLAPDVWFGLLSRGPGNIDTSEHIGLVDPVAYDSWCEENGGSPLLSGRASAAEITQLVIADPDFETTEPVMTTIGGMEAISIDVALAPGGEACKVGMIIISRWIHTIAWDPELRLRLYLVDLSEGMSVETLAITVVAPEERFQEFIEETAPIIESIEFHPAVGTTSTSEVP